MTRLSAAPRHGRISAHQGTVRAIDALWIPRRTSLVQVFLQRWLRLGDNDTCHLYYSSTRSQPGFITIDFLRSGPRTSLQTVCATLSTLDKIAEQNQAVAMFAQVTNSRMSDRIMRRFGWLPHANRLGPGHWIKRFYDGYPQSTECLDPDLS